MQSVSNAWKDNQAQAFLSEGFVEVSLDISDPDALADASSQDNGATYFSDTPQVVSEVDKNIVPYSTLEQNLWVLDGSRKSLPSDDYGDCGYVGDVLSEYHCGFTNKLPVVTINFTRAHHKPIPAVTVTWSTAYNEYAEDFIVTVYNGDNVVAEKSVTGNNSTKTIVPMDIVDYDRITISVLRWCLPYHRARVEEIFVGMNKVYTKENLFGYNHSQVVDPISTSLPKAEVSFSIDNMDGSYNPRNPDGLSKYLMERQEVKTRYGYKMVENRVEWIKGGTFYLSEWSAPQNGLSAEFTARDLLEFLFTEYKDNVSVISERNLYDLAQAVLEKANLPLNSDGSSKWYIDESLREITTLAPLPIDSGANCLMLIANAARCVLYQNRNGTIRIEPINNEDTDYEINMSNSYRKPEVSLSKPVKEIVVKVYQYTMGDKGIEETTTDTIIPVNDVGEQVTISNPLITDESRAVAVGGWARDYLINRTNLQMNWRPDVRLDALDIVKVKDDYSESRVRMTELKFTYNGGVRGDGRGGVI